MPIDVLAEVIANTLLSSDDNVLALRAPEIARLAAPGQFVMVKPAAGLDPLLLSPFSGSWMSFLDPARASAELGFRHELLGSYLDKIVTSFLAHPPAEPPPGYESRAAELVLVAG